MAPPRLPPEREPIDQEPEDEDPHLIQEPPIDAPPVEIGHNNLDLNPTPGDDPGRTRQAHLRTRSGSPR